MQLNKLTPPTRQSQRVTRLAPCFSESASADTSYVRCRFFCAAELCAPAHPVPYTKVVTTRLASKDKAVTCTSRV